MWFAWRSLSQDIELMPQYYDLGFQLLSRPEAVAQHADEQEADCYHAAIMFRFATDRESIGWSFRKRQGPSVFECAICFAVTALIMVGLVGLLLVLRFEPF